jgi:hypothetical protein
MKYAREIIDLMGAYPGREFRIREIVNAIAGKKSSILGRTGIKKGVWRALQQLEEIGTIAIFERKNNGSPAYYVWKK